MTASILHSLKLLLGHGYTVNTFLLMSVHGSAEEEQPATKSEEQNMPEELLQLASFTQQAMLKMLAFVDSIVAPNRTREFFYGR